MQLLCPRLTKDLHNIVPTFRNACTVCAGQLNHRCVCAVHVGQFIRSLICAVVRGGSTTVLELLWEEPYVIINAEFDVTGMMSNMTAESKHCFGHVQHLK